MSNRSRHEIDRYWFPAKRNSGLGWGPPTNWHGWVFLLGWLALFLSGIEAFDPFSLAQCVFAAGMIALMVLVLRIKGEPIGGARR